MKRVISLLLFVSLFTIFANAQNGETAIREAMKRQEAAWNIGDIPGFMQTYWHSDSLLFVSSNGPLYGWQNTLDRYKKNYPDTATMGKLNFTIVEIKQLCSDNYTVLGKWQLVRTSGNIGGYFTLLFRLIHGQWFIISDHTS